MDFNSGIYTVLDVQTDYYEKAEGFNWQSWKTVRARLHKRWWKLFLVILHPSHAQVFKPSRVNARPPHVRRQGPANDNTCSHTTCQQMTYAKSNTRMRHHMCELKGWRFKNGEKGTQWSYKEKWSCLKAPSDRSPSLIPLIMFFVLWFPLHMSPWGSSAREDRLFALSVSSSQVLIQHPVLAPIRLRWERD